MHLVNVVNAPVPIRLRGKTYRASALWIEHFGEILAWLQQRLGDPQANLSSQASRIALATTEGQAVVLHLSLLRCHPNLTRDEALELAATMTPEDEESLYAIAFRRGPMPPHEPSEDGEDRSGNDLASMKWGPIIDALANHTAEGYEAAGRLTLDQLDCFASKGETYDPDELDPADVQKMWEAAQGASPDTTTEVANDADQ